MTAELGLLGLLGLRLGGVLHFVQVPATLALAVLVRRQGLAQEIPVLLRRAMAVIAGGVVLAVFGGGFVSLLFPEAVLCELFGRVYTAWWLVFWSYRLAAQVFVYGPTLPTRFVWAHRLLLAVFSLKVACYAAAFVWALTGPQWFDNA